MEPGRKRWSVSCRSSSNWRFQRSTGRSIGRKRCVFWTPNGSLLESEASVEEVAEVLRLMNWLLALPVDEEVIFREELGRLQKDTSMRYISTYDRLVRAEALEEGLQKGLQKGRQEGRLTLLRETIVEALRERFGVVSESVHPRLEAVADEVVLRRLAKRVWTVGTLAEFEAEM
jgi:hypothetical protein